MATITEMEMGNGIHLVMCMILKKCFIEYEDIVSRQSGIVNIKTHTVNKSYNLQRPIKLSYLPYLGDQ